MDSPQPKSESCSPEQAQVCSQPTLIVRLKIPNFPSPRNARGVKKKEDAPDFLLPAVPSWNDLLSLDEWGRKRLKSQIAVAFLSALRAYESDYSMRTTCAGKSSPTFSDTLVAYQVIAQDKRKLRQASARQMKAKKSTPPPKSGKFHR